jgi:Protein of unknown function (DUF3592)
MPRRTEPLNLDDKIKAGILSFVGMLSLSIGFWLQNMQAQEKATFLETTGTVVDIVQRKERDKADRQITTYAPIVEFSTGGTASSPENQQHFTGYYGSATALTKGQVVKVVYNPKNPVDTARIPKPQEFLAPWVMFGIGGVWIGSALIQLSPWRKISD